MIKFEGRIVQFGFGVVGKSLYEKVSKEIKLDEKFYDAALPVCEQACGCSHEDRPLAGSGPLHSHDRFHAGPGVLPPYPALPF